MLKKNITNILDSLRAVVILTVLVALLPILIPIFIITQVLSKIARTYVLYSLRKSGIDIILYRGKNTSLSALVDAHVVPNIGLTTLVVPDPKIQNRWQHWLISKAFSLNEAAVVVVSECVKKRVLPLQNALLKFQKGNPQRLKNILFKLKTLKIETAESDLLESSSSIEAFKLEIIEELLSMANSQEDNTVTERYLIPIEDYELEFRNFNDKDLDIIWRFMESWVDEAGHGFQGFYGSIEKEDWPNLARSIVESLKNKKTLSEEVAARFSGIRFKPERPWYKNWDFYKVIFALLFFSIVMYQCNRDRSSEVCHQVNMKEC